MGAGEPAGAGGDSARSRAATILRAADRGDALCGGDRGAFHLRWMRTRFGGDDLLCEPAAGIYPAGDLQPRGARPDGVSDRGAAGENGRACAGTADRCAADHVAAGGGEEVIAAPSSADL